MPGTHEELRVLAQKFLSVDGQTDVDIHLMDGEEGVAKSYLLGAIDKAWLGGTITCAEARDAYNHLGMPPEEAADRRQKSGRWV